MKIAVIGDPHGVKVPKPKIQEVQAILITGDVGKADLAREQFFKKIEDLDYVPSDKEKREAYLETYSSTLDVLKYYAEIAPVFFVFGNVESTDSEVRKISREIGIKLPLLVSAVKRIKGVHIINNQSVNLRGLKIGGLENFLDTCWVKEFKPDKFTKKLKKAKKETHKAKKVLRRFLEREVEILISHQPPYGILDKVGGSAPEKWRGKHAGSKVVLDYIRRANPRYVFCGHIHEGKGKQNVGETEVYNVGANGDYVLLDIE